MSFLPGLGESIGNAVGSAWDATAGGVGSFVDWLTGKSGSSSGSSVAVEPKSLPNPTPDEGPKDPPPAPVAESNLVYNHVPDDASLMHLLYILKTEAVPLFEKRVTTSYKKVDEAHQKNKELTELLQILTQQSDNNGDFEVKDAKTKNLMAKARTLGVPIESKESFSKSERDAIIRNLDQTLKILGDEIRMGFSDTQEAIQQRNILYQELKTLWDKNSDAIKRMIQAINSR